MDIDTISNYMNTAGHRIRFEIYGLVISVMLHVSVLAGILLVKTGEFSGNYGAINVFIAENDAGNAVNTPARIKVQGKEDQQISVRVPESPAAEKTPPVLNNEVPVDSHPDVKKETLDKPEPAFDAVNVGINSTTPNEEIDREGDDHNMNGITAKTAPKHIVSDGYYIGDFGEKNGPRFIERTHPSYPLVARRLGREGRVVLKLIIDEEGHLMDVQIVRSAGYGFDRSAVRAIKRSSFRPAEYNGQPIKSKTNLPIRFVLKEK